MKLLNYVKSLLPTFQTSHVVEDMRLTIGEYKEHTIPAYNSAVELFKGWKFKSELLTKNFDIFNRMVEIDRGDNFVTTIHKSFKDVLVNLHHVESMIEKTFSMDVAAMGLTFQKANLLHYVEMASFVSKFSRKYLVYIYICETAQYEESGTNISESLTPVEIEWLNANFVSFCSAFNIIAGKPQMIEKQLANIPDVVITEDNIHTIEATMGANKVDPFQMGLIPVWMNPIYHVGMFIAEWQSSRYKAAKEEVKLLQLRKINLEKLSEGKPDARIQKEIEYMEGRIQGLNFKIDKMEQNAGV